MKLWNAPLFFMSNLKIINRKSGGTLALFVKDGYLSVCEWKGKTKTGWSSQNCAKRKGPPENTNICEKSVIADFDSFVIKTWVLEVSNQYKI